MLEYKCKANKIFNFPGLPVLLENLENKIPVVNSRVQIQIFRELRQRAGTSLPPEITHDFKGGRILGSPKHCKGRESKGMTWKKLCNRNVGGRKE